MFEELYPPSTSTLSNSCCFFNTWSTSSGYPQSLFHGFFSLKMTPLYRRFRTWRTSLFFVARKSRETWSVAREGPVATKKYQEMDFVAAILFKTSEHAHSQVSKMPCDFLSEKSSNQQLSTTFCCSPRSQSLRNLASKQIHPGILCEWHQA